MNTIDAVERDDIISLLLHASEPHKTWNKLNISLQKSKATKNLLNNLKKEQKIDDLTKEYLNIHSERYISEFSQYNSRITEFNNQVNSIDSIKNEKKVKKQSFKRRVLTRLDNMFSKQKISSSLMNIASMTKVDEENYSKIDFNSKNTLNNSKKTLTNFKKSNDLRQSSYENLDTSILNKEIKFSTDINFPIIRGCLKLKQINQKNEGMKKKIRKI